jgi:carnitine O-acetyltransferase
MDTYRYWLTRPISSKLTFNRWMFDCCRIPGPQGLDWSTTYAKEGDEGNTGHIVVFRNNRVWKVDLAPHGEILSTEEIEK